MLLVLSCTSKSCFSLFPSFPATIVSPPLPCCLLPHPRLLTLSCAVPIPPLASSLRLVTAFRHFKSSFIAVKVLTTRTLSRFHGEDIYVSSLFHGVGIFLFSFAGSMFLGVAFGLCCSLGLKHSHLASYPHIESCIVALVAYTSYFFSNGLSMSGEFHAT